MRTASLVTVTLGLIAVAGGVISAVNGGRLVAALSSVLIGYALIGIGTSYRISHRRR